MNMHAMTGSPPYGSFEGHWFVAFVTSRVTSQKLQMKVEPYCGQTAPLSEIRRFRIGLL